jgi:hypothetical protein
VSILIIEASVKVNLHNHGIQGFSDSKIWIIVINFQERVTYWYSNDDVTVIHYYYPYSHYPFQSMIDPSHSNATIHARPLNHLVKGYEDLSTFHPTHATNATKGTNANAFQMPIPWYHHFITSLRRLT